VTFETTQGTGSAELMAGCAIDRTVQRAMRGGQWAGRNLGRGREHKKAHEYSEFRGRIPRGRNPPQFSFPV
jgi:hypothetical protein